MADVTGIGIYRDGGTIEFRLTSSPVDGLYRLRTPFAGSPRPLSRDGEWLPLGGTVEVAVQSELRRWLSVVAVGDAVIALAELGQLSVWQNLPERLTRAVPLWHIRLVVEELSVRISAEPSAAPDPAGMKRFRES